MGAGRKTSTYDVDTGAQNEHARWRFESQQRLLGDKLGGVIFVCNSDTYEECITGQIFGLPSAHWCYVQNIVVGMPIFLYNYSTKQLHGIYESTTAGEWKLNPAGWTGNPDNTRTMYPCQVAVRPYNQCPPLDAMEHKPILKAAYFSSSSDPLARSKFSLELTKSESVALCQAFDRKKATAGGGSRSNQRPQPIPTPSVALAAQRPPAAATASAPPSSAAAAAAEAPVQRPKAAEPPSLKEEDFPALGGGSSRPPAWGKKPSSPQVDEDGFEMVVGRGKGPRGQAIAASSASAAKSAAAEVPVSQPARQPPPQINTRPAANGSDTTKVPEAPSTPPPTQKDASTSNHGQGTAPAASAPAPAASQSSFRTHQKRLGDMTVSQQASNNDDVYYCDPGAIEVSGSSAPDTTTAIAAVHAAVAGLDVAAADAIHNCFSVLTSHINRLEMDKTALAQALQASQADIGILRREQQRTRLEMAQLGQAAGVPISAEAPELQNMSSARPDKAILLLGGHDGQQWTTVMHLIYPELSAVQEYDQIPFAQGYGGSILLGRSIYVIGGGDGQAWNRTAFNFDLDSKDWFQVADMKQERGSLGVAEVGGLIYAIGGGRGGPRSINLDTVEVFTPELNAWHQGPKLHEQRFTTSAAAIDGAIYVTGGFNGTAYLTSAERLDPRVGAWQPVPEMPNKRGSHMSAVLGDNVYVMGGWDSENYLDHVEVYDTRAGRWRSAPPMATPRAYGSSAVMDDKIYMIGGLSDAKHGVMENHATSMERFDPVSNKWEQVCEESPISRAFMSAVVVDV